MTERRQWSVRHDAEAKTVRKYGLVLLVALMAACFFRPPPCVASVSKENLAPDSASFDSQNGPTVSFASSSIVWLPDGENFLVGASGTIWRFDKRAQNPPEPIIEVPELADPIVMAIDSKNTILAVGGYSNSRVLLWDYQSLDFIVSVESTSQHVTNLQFSPDGTLLAIAGSNTTADGLFYWPSQVQIWDMVLMKKQATLQDHIPHDPNLEFLNGDRQLLVAGSTWGMDYDVTIIQIWDVATSTMSASLPQRYLTTAVPFAHTDQVVVAGMNEYRNRSLIQIWDIETLTLVREIPAPDEFVSILAMSHDARLIATGNTSGTVRLWDVGTETELASFEGHGNNVIGLAFSPDDRLIASSSVDGTIRVWDAEVLGRRAGGRQATPFPPLKLPHVGRVEHTPL
jgi:WD40 repeat protein